MAYIQEGAACGPGILITCLCLLSRIARLTYLEYIVFKDMIAEEELGDNNSDPEDLDDMDEEDPKLSYKKYH